MDQVLAIPELLCDHLDNDCILSLFNVSREFRILTRVLFSHVHVRMTIKCFIEVGSDDLTEEFSLRTSKAARKKVISLCIRHDRDKYLATILTHDDILNPLMEQAVGQNSVKVVKYLLSLKRADIVLSEIGLQEAIRRRNLPAIKFFNSIEGKCKVWCQGISMSIVYNLKDSDIDYYFTCLDFTDPIETKLMVGRLLVELIVVKKALLTFYLPKHLPMLK
jgi:hypothetical protein